MAGNGKKADYEAMGSAIARALAPQFVGLQNELVDLRSELRSEISALRNDARAELQEHRVRLDQVNVRLDRIVENTSAARSTPSSTAPADPAAAQKR